eukprot:scaffold96886_cov33-Tisochrysis_lutea.AAC.2
MSRCHYMSRLLGLEVRQRDGTSAHLGQDFLPPQAQATFPLPPLCHPALHYISTSASRSAPPSILGQPSTLGSGLVSQAMGPN